MTRSSIIAALRHFWKWWITELTSLIPAVIRRGSGRHRASADLILRPDETAIERRQNGIGQRLIDPRPFAELDDDAWAQLGELTHDAVLRVILTPPDVFTTEIMLPRKVGSRLNQALTLQIVEIAPLQSEQLHWHGTPVGQLGEMLRVRVLMARRERVATLRERFADQGLPDPSFWGDTGQGPALVLPAASRGQGKWSGSSWLIVLVLLLSIPVTTTLGAILMTWSNESAMAAAADKADHVMRAEAKSRSIDALRQGISSVARKSAASSIINDLAARLPADASLTSLAVDDRGMVTLYIEAPDPDSVRAALEGDRTFRFHQEDEGVAADGKLGLTFSGKRR